MPFDVDADFGGLDPFEFAFYGAECTVFYYCPSRLTGTSPASTLINMTPWVTTHCGRFRDAAVSVRALFGGTGLGEDDYSSFSRGLCATLSFVLSGLFLQERCEPKSDNMGAHC